MDWLTNKSTSFATISNFHYQLCTICTIFAQFCSTANGLLWLKASCFKSGKTFFQNCAQIPKQIVQAKNPLPQPPNFCHFPFQNCLFRENRPKPHYSQRQGHHKQATEIPQKVNFSLNLKAITRGSQQDTSKKRS